MNLIETITTVTGVTYRLFETGRGFKSTLTTPAFVDRRGKNREEEVIARVHRTQSAAMNSKMRPRAATRVGWLEQQL